MFSEDGAQLKVSVLFKHHYLRILLKCREQYIRRRKAEINQFFIAYDDKLCQINIILIISNFHKN